MTIPCISRVDLLLPCMYVSVILDIRQELHLQVIFHVSVILQPLEVVVQNLL
jgi:hypothetical protein